MNVLERSGQEIPRTPEHQEPLAHSVALYGLEESAPAVKPDYDLEDVFYPFSNDQSVVYYDQLQARVLQPDYTAAGNRTAVLVGEGALMAALPYIPEDNIILLDNSASMMAYMAKYIEALRRAGSMEEWGDMMGLRGADIDSRENTAAGGLVTQASEWAKDGYATPFEDERLYEIASRQARRKAIIPWQADVISAEDMEALGEALRTRGANVTFMNLSNLMPYDETYSYAAEYVERLRLLPVTAQAPIMTTSLNPVWDPIEEKWRHLNQATGPFFGLDNLAEHGGSLVNKGGPAVARQYMGEPDGPPASSFFGFLSSRKVNWPAE